MDDIRELLRKALEAEADEAKRKAEVTPTEALRMIEALEKIRAGVFDEKPNAPPGSAERKLKLTPIDQAVETLKAGGTFKRELKRAKKVAKPKKHWSTKKALKRKYDRERYKEVLRPMRKAALAESIQTAEGWWEVARKGWERHGVPVEMTEEEFKTVVFPAFYPHVPVFFRLDKGKGWRLDNLLVRDTESRKVLFDGNDYVLFTLGYTL